MTRGGQGGGTPQEQEISPVATKVALGYAEEVEAPQHCHYQRPSTNRPAHGGKVQMSVGC
jgi:hypothetical protein